MNLDLFAQIDFGDALGLQSFMLAHRFIHDQQSDALVRQFNTTFSTFGLGSAAAEAEWIKVMETKSRPTPQALRDWLQLHAQIHIATFQTLGAGAEAPDLSTADFSQPNQFYDWMLIHAQMHDLEQSLLGVT